MCRGCKTGPTIYSLSEKSKKSNRLQMSLQRQQFLLTEHSSPLSVWSAKGIKLSMVHGISVCLISVI